MVQRCPAMASIRAISTWSWVRPSMRRLQCRAWWCRPLQSGSPSPFVERPSEPVPRLLETGLTAAAEPVAPPLQPATETAVLTRPVERAAAKPDAPQGDPLATVTALSYEEKIALFT